MKHIDWNELSRNKGVNSFTECFLNEINYNIEKNTTKVKSTYRKSGKERWITAGLLKAINIKNNLYKKMMKDQSNNALRLKYTQYRNILQKLIREAKKGYINNMINRASKAKSLWACVDDICGRSRPKTEINSIRDSSGQELMDKEKIVEEFSRYYSEIGKKLAEGIEEVQDGGSEHYCNETLFSFLLVRMK